MEQSTPTARPISTITELACTPTPDRRLVKATRPPATTMAIVASPSGSSAATTAPNAISSTASVIGKDSSSARCRSRSTVSLTALPMLASPVSAIRIPGWSAAAARTAASTGTTRAAESLTLPVIRNWSSAA